MIGTKKKKTHRIFHIFNRNIEYDKKFTYNLRFGHIGGVDIRRSR